MRRRPLTEPSLAANPDEVTRVLIEMADGTVLALEPTPADHVRLYVDPDVLREEDEAALSLTERGPHRTRPFAVEASLSVRMHSFGRTADDPAMCTLYEAASTAVLRPDGTPLHPPQGT